MPLLLSEELYLASLKIGSVMSPGLCFQLLEVRLLESEYLQATGQLLEVRLLESEYLQATGQLLEVRLLESEYLQATGQ